MGRVLLVESSPNQVPIWGILPAVEALVSIRKILRTPVGVVSSSDRVTVRPA